MAGAYGSATRTSSVISVCHCALSSRSVWKCRCTRSEAVVIFKECCSSYLRVFASVFRYLSKENRP